MVLEPSFPSFEIDLIFQRFKVLVFPPLNSRELMNFLLVQAPLLSCLQTYSFFFLSMHLDLKKLLLVNSTWPMSFRYRKSLIFLQINLAQRYCLLLESKLLSQFPYAHFTQRASFQVFIFKEIRHPSLKVIHSSYGSDSKPYSTFADHDQC